MLLRLCSLGIMLFYTMVLTIQTSEADVSNERKAVPDPFEFDLYEEPSNDSNDAYNRMMMLCARLQKRTSFSRDRKAAPLLFRLCDMLN
ncbi:unnamed protein product [Heligmosomoides polygyrus]|uniref:Uncharacterized protein n=1 Tax=Heligmosomoides polygyrus TaxID=6339 RepID=A0A183F282_HELPZ|nr:unnamed protein product [Heligmosomoides polygyrus]